MYPEENRARRERSTLPDSQWAGWLCVAPRKKPHDRCYNRQNNDRNEDPYRCEKRRARCRSRTRRRRIFCRQSALRICQVFLRHLVVRIKFQGLLIVGDRLLVILGHRVGETASRVFRFIGRILLNRRGVILDCRWEILQTAIGQGALIVVLLIVRVLLDRGSEISYRFVPLLQADVGKSTKLVDKSFVPL